MDLRLVNTDESAGCCEDVTDVFCGILLCWEKCGYISRFLLIYAMIYVKIQNEYL